MTVNATFGNAKTAPRAKEVRATPAARADAPDPGRAVRHPTHEQIAARAKAIWQAKGCPSGQDEQNWREAEAQLRAELSKA